MRAVRGRGPGTRPLWTRSWGGAHIVLYSDGLLTCACRLDNIFRSGNIYFGILYIYKQPFDQIFIVYLFIFTRMIFLRMVAIT